VQVSGGNTGQVVLIVDDHLGTPRMIADQTSSLANLKRHDYLPFGEEIFDWQPHGIERLERRHAPEVHEG
jgi:hypothetical protein